MLTGIAGADGYRGRLRLTGRPLPLGSAACWKATARAFESLLTFTVLDYPYRYGRRCLSHLESESIVCAHTSRAYKALACVHT